MRKGKSKRPQKSRKYNYYVDNPNLQELQFLDDLEKAEVFQEEKFNFIKSEQNQPTIETMGLRSTSLFASENILQLAPNIPVEQVPTILEKNTFATNEKRCEADSNFSNDQYEEVLSAREGKGDL